MKRLIGAAAIAAASLALVGPASATYIYSGAGWQYVRLYDTNTHPYWKFTIAPGATGDFRVTEAGPSADQLFLANAGTVVAWSHLFAGSALGGLGTNGGELAWENGGVGHLSYALGPGTYSLSLYSNCAGGCRTPVFVRLDDPPGAVPEPAAWAMMLVGFGGLGSLLRKRRTAVPA
jgi:hypothetical protein